MSTNDIDVIDTVQTNDQDQQTTGDDLVNATLERLDELERENKRLRAERDIAIDLPDSPSVLNTLDGQKALPLDWNNPLDEFTRVNQSSAGADHRHLNSQLVECPHCGCDTMHNPVSDDHTYCDDCRTLVENRDLTLIGWTTVADLLKRTVHVDCETCEETIDVRDSHGNDRDGRWCDECWEDVDGRQDRVEDMMACPTY